MDLEKSYGLDKPEFFRMILAFVCKYVPAAGRIWTPKRQKDEVPTKVRH